MTKNERLLEAIRETDRSLAAVHLPARASHRIRSSIRQRGLASERSRRGRVVAAVALMACLAILAGFLSKSRVSPSLQALPRSSPCVTAASAESMDLTGSCTVNFPSMQIETSGATALREMTDGVAMLRGTAMFDVSRVPLGRPPIRIRVSGGVIEVVGTKFLVEQRDGRGALDLVEGTIRFTFSSGRESVLHAGERLTWVDDGPATSPTMTIARPEKAGAAADGVSPEPSISLRDVSPGLEPADDDHLSLAKAHRRFREIRRGASYTETERLREQLEPASFELGNAMESDHQPRPQICAHWRWHLETFSAGIYNGVVADRLRKLGCQR